MRIILTNSARRYIGEAAHCVALARGLAGRGHEVILVARAGRELEARARDAGIRVESLIFPEGFSPGADWHDVRRLARLLRRERADLVHCHRGKDHWLTAMSVIAGAPRLPMVRTRHSVVPMRSHLPNRWLFGRRTAQVIAVSKIAGESLGPLKDALGGRFSVIHSAVDTERFSPERTSQDWRARLGVAQGQPLVGLVARLQRVKGQRVFLDAAAQVLERRPQTRFLVAGAGPPWKTDAMNQQVKALGIAHAVVFEGFLDDVPAAIASCDIGVIASLGSEGSSRIGYETMASGVPLIATTVGCLPEIVEHEKTGLLIRPGEADDLAAAICRILGDPAFGARLADAALERTRGYHSLDRWLDDILAVYEKALSR
jgi:glycosyltransferase involved in cell wall biosynthesis